MRRIRRSSRVMATALFAGFAASASAQTPEGAVGSADAVRQPKSMPAPALGVLAGAQERAAAADPWQQRPVCASMFLKADWQLTSKQKACNWLQNGVLSTGRIFTTATSAIFTMVVDTESERGDGSQSQPRASTSVR